MIFGENVEGYAVPVLNEREVRAGAGILFFVSLTVFLGAWYADLMLPAQMMIVGFFFDFLIRVTNPRYSPSLILGRFAVSTQTPEYTAASPKRFAWMIGLSLATIMVVTLIFLSQMSIMNFAICALCIVLLFMESAFGICLGCVVYNKVLKKEVVLCPGNICEIKEKEPIQKISLNQIILLVIFALLMTVVFAVMQNRNQHAEHTGPNHPLIQEMKNGLNVAPETMPPNHDMANHDAHKH